MEYITGGIPFLNLTKYLIMDKMDRDQLIEVIRLYQKVTKMLNVREIAADNFVDTCIGVCEKWEKESNEKKENYETDKI